MFKILKAVSKTAESTADGIACAVPQIAEAVIAVSTTAADAAWFGDYVIVETMAKRILKAANKGGLKAQASRIALLRVRDARSSLK